MHATDPHIPGPTTADRSALAERLTRLEGRSGPSPDWAAIVARASTTVPLPGAAGDPLDLAALIPEGWDAEDPTEGPGARPPESP